PTYPFTTTTTPQTYTLSLHDALPISNHHWAMAKGEESLKLELARLHAASREELVRIPAPPQPPFRSPVLLLLGATAVFAIGGTLDRKSTRLNSSHRTISYAVFCLKKK